MKWFSWFKVVDTSYYNDPCEACDHKYCTIIRLNKRLYKIEDRLDKIEKELHG